MKIAAAILFTLLLQAPVKTPELPSDARTLLRQHEQAVARLEQILSKDLAKLKEEYMKKSDLDSANAIHDLLNDRNKSLGKDTACGDWMFLGVKQQTINRFVFQSDGSIETENTYKQANWSRIDERTLLFRYYDSAGTSSILFHAQEDPDMMKGFHSTNGVVRYLKRPE